MKILVIKFMHIGDVLLTTPLLKNLRHHFPEARIDVALNEGTEEMITENPNVNNIYIYKKNYIKQLSFIKKLIEEIKFVIDIRSQKYDVIIVLNSSDRAILTAKSIGAKRIIGLKSTKKLLNKIYHKMVTKIRNKHWVDINLDALRILGKEPIEKKVEIFWSDAVEKKIINLLEEKGIKEKHFIHFHPVSRWLFKCIDNKIAANIIDYCQDVMDIPVVITAAPIQQEKQKVHDILALCKTKPLDLGGKLSLKETAALNKKSLIYIGVDTAIMHISAANDIPVLAFFGPSIPYAWGPWDNSCMQSQYICFKGNQSMGKHYILQKGWECVPCDSKGCNNSGISDCLMIFNFEEIKECINELLVKSG